MVAFLVLGFAFLGLLIGISVVCFGVLKSSRSAPGQRTLSGVLAVLGLGATAFAGFVGLLCTIGLVAVTAFIEHGPVRSVEIIQSGHASPASFSRRSADERDGYEVYAAELEAEARQNYGQGQGEDPADGGARLDPGYPVHVLVEFSGHVDETRLRRWLRRETHGDVALLQAQPILDDGRHLTWLDFGVDIDEDDLNEFLDQIQVMLPGVDVPEGLRIEVKTR